MKYTLYGYRQDVSCELGLYFDELAILRYIDDFRNTGDMYFEEIEGRKYYWVLYEKMIKDYPTFKTRFKDPVRKVADMMRKGNLNKVLDFKLLHWNGRKKGTYTFFAINEEIYQELIAPIIDKKEVKKEIAPTSEPSSFNDEEEITSENWMIGMELEEEPQPQQEPQQEPYKEEQQQEIFKPSSLNAEKIEEYVNKFDDDVKPYAREYLKGKGELFIPMIKMILNLPKDKQIEKLRK